MRTDGTGRNERLGMEGRVRQGITGCGRGFLRVLCSTLSPTCKSSEQRVLQCLRGQIVRKKWQNAGNHPPTTPQIAPRGPVFQQPPENNVNTLFSRTTRTTRRVTWRSEELMEEHLPCTPSATPRRHSRSACALVHPLRGGCTATAFFTQSQQTASALPSVHATAAFGPEPLVGAGGSGMTSGGPTRLLGNDVGPP